MRFILGLMTAAGLSVSIASLSAPQVSNPPIEGPTVLTGVAAGICVAVFASADHFFLRFVAWSLFFSAIVLLLAISSLPESNDAPAAAVLLSAVLGAATARAVGPSLIAIPERPAETRPPKHPLD